MRHSKAFKVGSYRVRSAKSGHVASHVDSRGAARKEARFWVRFSGGAMEIQERFPSGTWVTVETVKRKR